MPRTITRSPKTNEYGDLKIVTINVPVLDLAVIERFINELLIAPSRSEYVRIAIKNQIERDIEMTNAKIAIAKGRGKYDPKKFVFIPGYNGDKPFRIIKGVEDE